MDSASDNTIGVRPAHRFNEKALLSYLQATIEGFPQPPAILKVSQFGHGQSNPTFLLEVELHGAVSHYVLRKKPPGKLLQSAHAVEREYQVLFALGRYTDVPVPKVYCLCNDSNIIGTPFYVMEYIRGRIFTDPGLGELDTKERSSIYRAVATTLASIHRADVDAIGLSNYGRRENYCKRQVERWAAQYFASTGEGKPDRDPRMLELINWLRNNVPAEDSEKGSRTGLVHGDFRIDNLVFHPSEARVLAVLDWELSTLGNQMSDVAYSSMPYIIDNLVSPGPSHYGFEGGIIPSGVPSQEEYLAVYCAAAVVPWPANTWKFYISLSLFRLASISAGVYLRWLQGNASGGKGSDTAGEFGHYLTAKALEFIQKSSVLHDQPPQSRNSLLQLYQESPQKKVDTSGFVVPPRVHELRKRVVSFMEMHVYPNECNLFAHAQSEKRWQVPAIEEELKTMAKAEGLWNLWIPADSAALASKVLNEGQVKDKSSRILGASLTNLEYAYICEVMGRSPWAPQIFNCNAPDTGNMEVLLRYGNPEQQKTWLKPLLDGEIRSAFAMTEPQVASSDATNISCSIIRDGDCYVINGRKWWTSGAMDPRCKVLIVMGKTNANAAMHKQQSMILVDINSPGIKIVRPLNVFGFDDAPHGHAEVLFENVRVPLKNLLLGEGRGFEIAQGRLGPGRLHHCMRLVGAAERGIEMMTKRALERMLFKKPLAKHGAFTSVLAECRLEIEKARLLVLHAANQLDLHGNRASRGAIAMAKVGAPRAALKVLDAAIQVHGGAGVSSDFVLSYLWVNARTLRIADGPDEVHLETIAKLELAKAKL